MTIVRWWLLWQGTLMAVMLLGAFMAMRVHLQVKSIRQDVLFIRELLLVWVTYWGQEPSVVRVALDGVVAKLFPTRKIG